jgi:hypothetical protein
MLDSIKPQCAPAFLDSGAYSVSTGKWDFLPLGDYIKFTDEYHKHFRVISVPDVIGDTQATIENANYFFSHTAVPRHKIANVYHVNSSNIRRFPEVVSQSIDAGISTISLGGLVGFPKNKAVVALDWIYNYLSKTNSPLKTHIFGGGDPMIVKFFRPDSIDSASFIHMAKGFSYHLYDYDNWKMKRDKLAGKRKFMDRKYITQESVDYLMEHSDLLLPFDENADNREYVYKAVEGIADSDKVLLVNGLNVRRFEKYAREKLGYDFKHYVSYRGFDSYKNPYVYSGFREIWRERPLNPYFEFWKVQGRAFEKLINVFGELENE